MEHISRNVDNIVVVEMERYRAKLLASPKKEQLYRDLLENSIWSDGRQGSLKKPYYIFGDSGDCEERHSTEHITFSFIHFIGETIIVSTELTYKRGSFVLSLKLTIPARDDGQIAWGTRECTFKTGIFQHKKQASRSLP